MQGAPPALRSLLSCEGLFTLGLLGLGGRMLPSSGTEFLPRSDLPVLRSSKQASERTDPSRQLLGPTCPSACLSVLWPSDSLCPPGCREQPGTSCPPGAYSSTGLWPVAEASSSSGPSPWGVSPFSTFLPVRELNWDHWPHRPPFSTLCSCISLSAQEALCLEGTLPSPVSFRTQWSP